MRGYWIALERETPAGEALPDMLVGPHPTLALAEHALDHSLLIDDLAGSTDNPYVTTEVVALEQPRDFTDPADRGDLVLVVVG